MSKSTDSHSDRQSAAPRAVVHKNILDAAVDQPDASMKELAESVTGATIDLVEQVLNEYGDPGEEVTAASDGTADVNESSERGASEPMRETNGHKEQYPDEEELTEKQRETLCAIREYPEATQADLADILGVSPATINARVNSIEDFDWERRHEFVEAVVDHPPASIEPEPDRTSSDQTEERASADDTSAADRQHLEQQIRDIAERIERLEERVEDKQGTASPVKDDPELAHKVLHACLESEQISDAEELEIVKAFLD